MLSYTDEFVVSHATDIIGKPVEITPVGHHQIGRNLVYKVTTGETVFILKYYFKPNKCANEIRTSKLLEEAGIACPKVLCSGITSDGFDYALIEFVDGETLLSVQDKLSQIELSEIYRSMGETLAKIHNIRTFDHFKTWEVTEENKEWVFNFKKAVRKDIDRFFNRYDEDSCDDYQTFKTGYDQFIKNIDLFDQVKTAVLCHHDFSARNMMVKKENGFYRLKAVFDFEHSQPSADILDFIDTSIMIKDSVPQYLDDFSTGYLKNRSTTYENMNELERLASIYIPIVICSWSKENAPDFYEFGLNLLKQNI
ncbi:MULTISPECIES: aminoglycoside phosphotransferase family protein [unclassified Fusibacter]|uniref:aminoglycoside phosphotransferase family protein n=1 Tax=unclassified Fusibacter TaxID=2624464 RepID=UPI001013B5E8|nr:MULTISPECIES: aminoglycoside phosphotransferase family protein [unclassified Fusibacter]MCK8059146.1 aminoglycoside phosphotransferase family protein [Fusibacter sp. A2]NPE22555.1 aminoglycoside phosphotransferase family protein [Fusibacter sp. A1]RXV60657.1 aminoglycoside phosphotransferase family protein [Fusibacter sp. A1]